MSDHTSLEELDQPAMIIDTGTPQILDANASGRRLWGLAQTCPMPVRLDPAMPALNDLRQGNDKAEHSTPLVFWTWNGAQRLYCSTEPLSEPQTIRVLFDQPNAATAPIPPTNEPVSTSPEPRVRVNFRAMAHELRTPISAIIALSEMIEHQQLGPIGDSRYVAYARDIGDSARLSLNIVATTLEREIEEGAILPGGFSELNVNQIVQKSIRTMHQAAGAANITLVSKCPHDLPNLIANVPALTQILLNLLTNAIKFTPQDGTVTVEAGLSDNGELSIAVQDTGVGMTEIDRNVLLAHEDAGDGTGNSDDALEKPDRGIGFSLVRRLAKAMTAKFEVASTRGVGTRVSLTFPSAKVIPVAAPSKET